MAGARSATGLFSVMGEAFKKLVSDAKTHISEISTTEAAALKQSDPKTVVIDVRETKDWEAGHVPGAVHLSRGVVELEIEEAVPDVNTPIICYCGGGGRSALVADSLQKMGYKNVRSMAGGFRAWKERGGGGKAS